MLREATISRSSPARFALKIAGHHEHRAGIGLRAFGQAFQGQSRPATVTSGALASSKASRQSLAAARPIFEMPRLFFLAGR